MKKYLLIILILLFAKAHSAFSQTGDTTLTYLSHLNLDIYKNKPVNSFLLHLPNNYISTRLYGHHISKYADVLSLTYAGRVKVYIYVYKFKFMNPRSETMNWDINLFKKEDIHHIEIKVGLDCYNGCQ